MHRKALGKHGWSIIFGLLLSPCVVSSVHAAPNAPARIAIGTPEPNSLVAGRITMSLGFDTGTTKITSFTVFVDDNIHYSRDFLSMSTRGFQYLELDTRTLTDGNHTVKIVARGARGMVASDTVNLTVRNGVEGGPDLVPPLVQFRGLTDGQEVSGKIKLDVLAEDNTTKDLLVSIFVNQFPRLIRSSPPYDIDLDTTQYLDPATNTGTIKLEAWAYDKLNNLGKARPLTLNVVLKANETKLQGDPLGGRPVQMGTVGPREPGMLPMNDQVFVVPVPGPMPLRDPKTPPMLSEKPSGGRPIIPREGVEPGPLPPPTRIAKATPTAIDPDFAPIGSAGARNSGTRSSLPYAPPRPSTEIAPAENDVRAPDAVRTPANTLPMPGKTRDKLPGTLSSTGPKAVDGPRDTVSPEALPAGPASRAAVSGSRVSQPAARLPKAPTPAVEKPVVKPSPGTAQGSEAAIQPKIEGPELATNRTARDPEIVEMPGTEIPVEMGMPSRTPSGPRVSMPAETRPAPKPAVKPSPKITFALLDKNAKPGANGRVPVDVYEWNLGGPKDRMYKLQPGDSLTTVSRKFKVTPRSLMLANGISNTRGVRAGSIVKVPGAFDVVMNDKRVAFDVNPRVENGLPLAPFRQIFEHAGGVVVWDGDSQEVRAANDSKDVRLKIGSKEAVVNQMIVVMDREAFLDSGRTIVPVSFMEKALDMKAEYDVKNGTIILVRK